MATLNFNIGSLHAGRVRDYLKIAKLQGLNIEWVDISGGLFVRRFVVKGESDDVKKVMRDVQQWAKENELE